MFKSSVKDCESTNTANISTHFDTVREKRERDKEIAKTVERGRAKSGRRGKKYKGRGEVNGGERKRWEGEK